VETAFDWAEVLIYGRIREVAILLTTAANKLREIATSAI